MRVLSKRAWQVVQGCLPEMKQSSPNLAKCSHQHEAGGCVYRGQSQTGLKSKEVESPPDSALEKHGCDKTGAGLFNVFLGGFWDIQESRRTCDSRALGPWMESGRLPCRRGGRELEKWDSRVTRLVMSKNVASCPRLHFLQEAEISAPPKRVGGLGRRPVESGVADGVGAHLRLEPSSFRARRLRSLGGFLQACSSALVGL